MKERYILTLDEFLQIKPLPVDDPNLHKDFCKFRVVTEEGVKKLEISIMTHGWCQSGTSEIRLLTMIESLKQFTGILRFTDNDNNAWMRRYFHDGKPYGGSYVEEGNHRQRALKNLKQYFSDPTNLPSHMKPYKNKFVAEDKSKYLPEHIICTESDYINRGHHVELEKEHARKSTVVNFTIYKSFTIMARDYDEWLKTNPQKISFPMFAYDANYELTDRNKALYSFLSLRDDEELMRLWQEDDERNRITINNFVRVAYPGTTKEEKDRWRKEHLRQMLQLPHGQQIKSRATANKLVKLLSEGKIKDYTEDVKPANDTASKKDNKVSLKGTSITDDIKAVLQRQFPDKTLAEVVVKFA